MSESWMEKAGRLSGALAGARDGGKLIKIERIARENELSPQTVHHLLRAHDFLMRLRSEDAELESLVAALPYQGVLAAERWYTRNRTELFEYLQASAKPSVRQLTMAEKTSRSLPPATGAPAQHAIDVLRSAGTTAAEPGPELRALLNWARVELFDLKSVVWEPETGDYERAHGIDVHGLAPTQTTVALLVGPSSEAAGYYMRNAKLLWFNAVSAASLFPVVIMLLPTRAAQAAVLTTMPLPPNGQGDWPKWNMHDPGRGQPRSGPARPATPAGGIILVTTPENLLTDWQR